MLASKEVLAIQKLSGGQHDGECVIVCLKTIHTLSHRDLAIQDCGRDLSLDA
jgi:hypothetical protein